MIGKKVAKRFLDPQTCFEIWTEVGSIGKTSDELARRGIVNPKTGKLVSNMGIWNASWLYVFNNLGLARERIERVWKANNEVLTDEKWYTMVLERASHIYDPITFAKFVESHPYMKPYAPNKEQG